MTDPDHCGPHLLRWLLRLLFVVIGVSVVAGIAAAAIGGSFANLGSGFGGLYGVPALLLTLLALGMGIPAGIVVARRLRSSQRWLLATGIVIGGVFVVVIGYAQVAHTLDPCANGWWGPGSMIGSQPLCERFGSELTGTHASTWLRMPSQHSSSSPATRGRSTNGWPLHAILPLNDLTRTRSRSGDAYRYR